MAAFYIDTSALFKRYRSEPGTPIVEELVDRRKPGEVFLTSYLTSLEVEAAVARALKARLLSQRASRVILGRFSQDSLDFLFVEPLTNAVVSAAIDVVRRHGLRAGDALHLATAMSIRSQYPEMAFVTSDGELASAAVTEGLTLLDPTHPSALNAMHALRA